jgi:GTP diphosphokinase / guanosine-3',5'-bis(diphosphate) 3'-diphosphatase
MAIEENDLKLILKALEFSARKHKNQRRKDVEASPYINHPISLVNILCNETHITDVNVICGALLHDTIEDTETEPEELEHEFGIGIKDIVMDLPMIHRCTGMNVNRHR